MSNKPETLAPLINKLDQANNELTLDIQRENDEDINYEMSLFGRITKPINPNYHQESSDAILNDVLHSMSILSKPGDEGMFSFNAEELNLMSSSFDNKFKDTLKGTQINTAKILMSRIKKEVK